MLMVTFKLRESWRIIGGEEGFRGDGSEISRKRRTDSEALLSE